MMSTKKAFPFNIQYTVLDNFLVIHFVHEAKTKKSRVRGPSHGFRKFCRDHHLFHSPSPATIHYQRAKQPVHLVWDPPRFLSAFTRYFSPIWQLLKKVHCNLRLVEKFAKTGFFFLLYYPDKSRQRESPFCSIVPVLNKERELQAFPSRTVCLGWKNWGTASMSS